MSQPELSNLSDVDYLRNLSDRLFRIPVCYGTDQYDCDRLNQIAEEMEEKTHESRKQDD